MVILIFVSLSLYGCAPPGVEVQQPTMETTPVQSSPTIMPSQTPTSVPLPTQPQLSVEITLEPNVTEKAPMNGTLTSPSTNQNPVDQAVADLAQRLNIPAEIIEVVAAEAVVWSDSSLGCPQPGMAYAQALVEGMRIQLRAGEQVYSYHRGRSGAPFLCATPQEPFRVGEEGENPDT
jgi:hypothetical protein